MFLHKKLFTAALIACLGCGVQYALPNAVGTVVTVATFDPAQSQLPEGVAIDKEGNIYVGFYPTGQILKMTPHGEQSIFATLDVSGSLGGGLVGFVLDEEGNLYVCDASGEPATHGIWKVERSGASRLIAALDPTGFPNALVFDPEGNL